MGLTCASTGKAVKKEYYDIQNSDITVALLGNPNVGKSTLFNYITGMHQHTGNWSGKTVSCAIGSCTYKGRDIVFVDLPGCCSLRSRSAEEEIAKEFIMENKSCITVVVCDATALERNLILALTATAISENVIICINLIDEANKKGITVDTKQLEAELGARVILTAARSGEGVSELLEQIIKTPENIKDKEHCGQEEPVEKTVVRAEEIFRKCVKIKGDTTKKDRKADKVLMGWLGFPVMLLMLLGVFWLTIVGANAVSEVLSAALFKTEEWLNNALIAIKTPQFLRELIVFGGYRMLVWVVSVMLPPMAIFFPLFTLLEDLGYLPRVAFNLDRCFKSCGACGKQALTMCMGFGCNAAGVVGARIIDSPRERLIAIITNSFVPCNGRFPAMISIIGIFIVGGVAIQTITLMGFITLGVLMTFIMSGFLSRTFLKGEPSSFILELPPYRRPQIGKIIIRSMFDRTLFVLSRAVAAAVPAGMLLWLGANIYVGGESIFAQICAFLEPVGGIMGLDGVILAAFILGFPANETVIPIMIMGYLSGTVLTDTAGLAELHGMLLANGWDLVRAFNMIVFFLFHWPCATTLITIYKETKSIKWTLLSFCLPTVVGAFVCVLINSACNLLA